MKESYKQKYKKLKLIFDKLKQDLEDGLSVKVRLENNELRFISYDHSITTTSKDARTYKYEIPNSTISVSGSTVDDYIISLKGKSNGRTYRHG
ncbi:MAG: hypothetical protein WC783_00440 [Candidatus Paceibacterota bacterium]|jgi:hypothetical protein